MIIRVSVIIVAFLLILLIKTVLVVNAYEETAYAFATEADYYMLLQEEKISLLREIREDLYRLEKTLTDIAEIKISNLLWLVGLTAFSIAIAIMTMFSILWGAKK